MLNWTKKVMKLKGALLTPELANPKFYAGNTIYSEMEATSKDTGSGRYIIENNKIGYEAVNMGNIMTLHDTTKYDLIYRY